MKTIEISTDRLIPTDVPRGLQAVLKWIPYFVDGQDVPPVVVVPNLLSERLRSADLEYLATWEHFVCQGNHRAAAAAICRRPITCRVLTSENDIAYLTAGAVARLTTLTEIEEACRTEARAVGFSAGSWELYLGMTLGPLA